MELDSPLSSKNKIVSLEEFTGAFTPLGSPDTHFNTSLEVSPNRSRRFFDERLISRLTLNSPTKDFDSNPGLIQKDNDSNKQTKSPKLNWARLRKICDIVYSDDSLRDHGNPTIIIVNDARIAIGTNKNVVYIFTMQQELLNIIETTNLKPSVTITSIAISFDSTYLVVGYSNGHINLWDLKKVDPIIKITPVTLLELRYNGSHHRIGHLEGEAVHQLEFIGTRHTAFLSSDHTGLLFYHDGGRSLMGYYSRSKILIGKQKLDNGPDYLRSILDFHSLPLGRISHPSDSMGIIVAITPQALVVVSTSPNFETQLKIGKSSEVDTNLDLTGFVSWYPVSGNSGKALMPVLAYSWTNILILQDLSLTSYKNEYDEVNNKLDFVNKRKWKCIEPIVALKWFNANIIFVMTKSHKAYFLSRKDLRVLKEVDLIGRNLKVSNMFTNNDMGLEQKSYSKSLDCFKSNIFTLETSGVSVGSLSNWADILVDQINHEKYLEALVTAKEQYLGTSELLLLGLPENDELRHDIVRNYVVQVFRAFLNNMFTQDNEQNNEGDKKNYSNFLYFALETCIVINADHELYDSIYELFTSHGYETLFFEQLEEFIFNSKIYVLSPTILKAMVENYFSNGYTSTLEQLICLLDISQLDIDFTITLCKKYHLNDTLAFIWGSVLDDYFTPMMDALKQIRIYNEDESMTAQQKFEIYQNASFVYPFISFTLTGRQYPTDRPINYKIHERAKLNVYYFLFSGSAISWPPDTPKFHTVTDYEYEPAFPYLHVLIKFDSKSMMASLNEAFEDDLLNDDGINVNSKTYPYELEVNRQYIIDILLSMYNSEEFRLSFIDKVYIGIFVSRNYPKYQQFIKLAGSIMHDLVLLLCKVGIIYHKNLEIVDLEARFGITSDEFTQITYDLVQDCELSLQSLLSIYRPLDVQTILIQIEDAQYYNVMLNIYKLENMYYEILKLWIKLQTTTKNSKEIDNENPFSSHQEEINFKNMFQPIPNMVHSALKNSPSHEFNDLVRLLENNFELFVNSDPKGMARIVATDHPDLAKKIINLKDSKSKFEFLREIFELNSQGKSANESISSDNKLKYEYLKSLIQELDYCRETGKDTEVAGKELKKFALSLGKLQPEIIELLMNSGTEGCLVLVEIYVREGKYETAHKLLTSSIQDIVDSFKIDGYTPAKEKTLLKLFNNCFSNTESSNELLNQQKPSSDLKLKESLLLMIVEFSVQLFTEKKKSLKNDSEEDDELKLFKRMVQMSFTYITNIGKSNSQSFAKIFENYLNRSSVKLTTLGDVRSVLNEVFFSYINDEQIMTLVWKLVNYDIFDDFSCIQSLKNRGWSPINTDCEICGKKVWGAQIGADIYESWKNHQLVTVGLETNNIEDKDKDEERALQVYVFQCKHLYHTKCLEGMGMYEREKKCIICEPSV